MKFPDIKTFKKAEQIQGLAQDILNQTRYSLALGVEASSDLQDLLNNKNAPVLVESLEEETWVELHFKDFDELYDEKMGRKIFSLARMSVKTKDDSYPDNTITLFDLDIGGCDDLGHITIKQPDPVMGGVQLEQVWEKPTSYQALELKEEAYSYIACNDDICRTTFEDGKTTTYYYEGVLADVDVLETEDQKSIFIPLNNVKPNHLYNTKKDPKAFYCVKRDKAAQKKDTIFLTSCFESQNIHDEASPMKSRDVREIMMTHKSDILQAKDISTILMSHHPRQIVKKLVISDSFEPPKAISKLLRQHAQSIDSSRFNADHVSFNDAFKKLTQQQLNMS